MTKTKNRTERDNVVYIGQLVKEFLKNDCKWVDTGGYDGGVSVLEDGEGHVNWVYLERHKNLSMVWLQLWKIEKSTSIEPKIVLSITKNVSSSLFYLTFKCYRNVYVFTR